MPIRPENRSRYPKDWPAISHAVRQRAANRCEECGVPNRALGGRSPDGRFWPAQPTGESSLGLMWPRPGEHAWCSGWPDQLRIIRIVLTVAHLGTPAHAPLFLHVAGNAVTDEVVDMIGLIMPLDAKSLEWQLMMHNRATTEFLRRSSAGGTGFLVALPSEAPGLAPRGTVILDRFSSGPIWISVSSAVHLGEPFHPTFVTTETAARPNIESTYRELLSAALAYGHTEAALQQAPLFVATGRRAGFDAVASLLRRYGENRFANNALSRFSAFPSSTPNSGSFDADVCSRNAHSVTGIRAGLSGFLGGMVEHSLANNAGSRQSADSWSGHADLYHIAEYPENCAPKNLKALCQRCHLRLDAKSKTERRRARERETKASGGLL